jgi:hypothetical protein
MKKTVRFGGPFLPLPGVMGALDDDDPPTFESRAA